MEMDSFGGVQQEQYVKTPQDLYTQELQEQKLQNILTQLDPANQLTEIEMRLRGYKRDTHSRNWVKSFQGLDNDKAIDRYIGFLSADLNLTASFGNMSAQEINRILDIVIKWVIDDLDSHAEEYGFGDDYSERSRVAYIMVRSVFAVLKLSENGQLVNKFFKSLGISESLGYAKGNEQKTPIWQFWKR